MTLRDAPHWWDWPFEPQDHVEDQMIARRFTLVDLLEMVEETTGWTPSHVPGRFVLSTSRDGRPWEVIVEPNDSRVVVEIVTAYEVKPL